MEHKQIEAKFDPNAEQLAFANAYIASAGNILKACQAIGDMHRNKYYGPNGWRNQDGFELWLSEFVKTEVMKREGKWYLLAEKYAEAGSYKHLELLFSLAHKFDKPEDKGYVVNVINSYCKTCRTSHAPDAPHSYPNNPPLENEM